VTYYLNPVGLGPVTSPVAVGVGSAYSVLIRILEGGGDGMFYYEHDQAVPAGDWLIVHGLGKYPNVSVYDDTGSEVLADIQNVDVNTVHVVFSYMASGKAVCS
jgi:hypothetical protein